MPGLADPETVIPELAIAHLHPVAIAIFVGALLEVKVVYNLILDANSVILVCVTVPFIVGVWWKRANRTGALASMGMGFLTWSALNTWILVLATEFDGCAVMVMLRSFTLHSMACRNLTDWRSRTVV